MNWWAILGAGLLAGATTCAVAQGGLLVGLINRQKKLAAAAAGAKVARRGGRGQPAGEEGAARRAATGAKRRRSTAPIRRRPPTTSSRSPGSCSASSSSSPWWALALGAFGSFIALDARIGGIAQFVAAGLMIVFGLGAAGVPGFRDIRFTPPESWTRAVRRAPGRSRRSPRSCSASRWSSSRAASPSR